MNIESLQNRIEQMLEGEKKRREIAIKWLNEIDEILQPLMPQLYLPCDFAGNAAFIPTKSKSSGTETFGINKNVYFRWGCGNGFYSLTTNMECKIPKGGTELYEIYGTEFWYCVSCIVEAIPLWVAKIDEINIARGKLIAKLAQ